MRLLRLRGHDGRLEPRPVPRGGRAGGGAPGVRIGGRAVRLDLPGGRNAVPAAARSRAAPRRPAGPVFRGRRRRRTHPRGQPGGRDARSGARVEGRRDRPGLGGHPVLRRRGALRRRTPPRRGPRRGGSRNSGCGRVLRFRGSHPRTAGADSGNLLRERRAAGRRRGGPRVRLPARSGKVEGARGGSPAESPTLSLRRRPGRHVAGDGRNARKSGPRALRDLELGAAGPGGPAQSQVLDPDAHPRARGVGARALGRPTAGQRRGSRGLPRPDRGRGAAARPRPAGGRRRGGARGSVPGAAARGRCPGSRCRQKDRYRRRRPTRASPKTTWPGSTGGSWRGRTAAFVSPSADSSSRTKSFRGSSEAAPAVTFAARKVSRAKRGRRSAPREPERGERVRLAVERASARAASRCARRAQTRSQAKATFR